MSSLVGFIRTLSRFLRSLARVCRGPEFGFKLRNLGHPVVQFGVQHADLPQIPALEARQVGAQVGQFQLTLGQSRPDASQFFAFAEKLRFLRRQLPDDLAWHCSYSPSLQLSMTENPSDAAVEYRVRS